MPNELQTIILNKPGVRQTALRYISITGATPRLKILADCASSGYFVDDAALVELANSIVATKFNQRKGRAKELNRLINACDEKSYSGLYSRMWLQSKYADPEELLDTIIRNRGRWSPHDHLGRLIGSFSPLFSGDQRQQYMDVLNRSRNNGFRSVLQFHRRLSSRREAFNAMFPALRAPNQSLGTGITHSKFLSLLSALRNPEASDNQKLLLQRANNSVLEDVFYRGMAQAAGVAWTEV